MFKTLQKGYGILFLGVLLNVVPYIITDYGFKTFPNANIINAAFWGYLTGVIAVSPFFFATKKNRNILKTEIKNNKYLIIKIVLLSGIGALFWFYSMKFGKSGVVSFLKKSDIVFTLLLGTIFLKERISKQEIVGAILSVIGFIIMSQASLSEISVSAILAIVCTQVFYVLQSFLVKRDAKNMNPFALTFVRITGMACFAGIFGLITNQISIPSKEFLLIFGLGQFVGAFLYRVAYFESHKHLDISKISIFLLMSPVLILIASWLFLGEEIHTKKVIGALIILIGLAIFTLAKNKKKKFTNK